MLNNFLFFLLLIVLSNHLVIGLNYSEEIDRSFLTKRYELSICTIFKDEFKDLKEWIDYHQMMGVDHFYIYNTGSADLLNGILSPYIQERIVTLIPWITNFDKDQSSYRWTLGIEIPAYENAVNFLARDQTKWLVCLNLDEFLVSEHGNIKEVLEKYESFPGISISDFSKNANVSTKFRKNLIQISIEHTIKQKKVDPPATKMIFKPEFCSGFQWPPYQCCFKYMMTSVEADKLELGIKIKNSKYPLR